MPVVKRPSRSSLSTALCALGVLALTAAPPTLAQEIGDPSRLAGIDAVAIRADASWDELITTSAGGATEGQFQEALLVGLEAALSGAETGPEVDPGEASFVLCHVDTFYDSGLIVYAVRVSYHRVGADGLPVIAWLESWVGSYTTQQLHVIWTLADQCAAAFLEDWRTANS